MLEALKTLKEKIEWIEQYLEHISQVSSKTAELLFQATQIPRKSTWNDEMIHNLLSYTDKKRTAYDELCNLYNSSVYSEIVELKIMINEEFNALLSEKNKISEKANESEVAFDAAKKNYERSLRSENVDRWICCLELKFCYKRYLLENKAAEKAFRSKSVQSEKVLDFYRQRYETIIRTFFRIQSNHFSSMFNILEYNMENKISQNIYIDKIQPLEEKDTYENSDESFESKFLELLSDLNEQFLREENIKMLENQDRKNKFVTMDFNSKFDIQNLKKAGQNSKVGNFNDFSNCGNDMSIYSENQSFNDSKESKTNIPDLFEFQSLKASILNPDENFGVDNQIDHTLGIVSGFYSPIKNGFEHENADKFYDDADSHKINTNDQKITHSFFDLNEPGIHKNQEPDFDLIPLPIKYGIFRVKKPKHECRLMFIVLTNTNYLHFFDIDLILENSPHINTKYNIIIKKICENAQKNFLFFFDTNKKTSHLNYQEEMLVKDLSDSVLENHNLVMSLIKEIGFKVDSKNIKLDKDKYELIITDKKQSAFSAFFNQNSTKIRPIVLKDLYELWFGIQNKDFVHKNIMNSKPFSSNEKVLSRPREEPETFIPHSAPLNWNSINDPENPWEDI